MYELSPDYIFSHTGNFFIKKNIGFKNNSYFKKFINFKFFCFSKEEVEEFLKHVSVKKEIEEYQSTILSVYI